MNESNLPFVSVCVSTFKRRQFLEEFYWCYLQQDYPKDRRELIILDDAGQYTPVVDTLENIKIVSTGTRFTTLGQKRNAFISLMDHRSEFLVIADDDDLYYPHWISSLMKSGNQADVIFPATMIEWIWERYPAYRNTTGWGYYNAASALRKSAFMEIGGYPHRQRQEDYELFSKFESNRTRFRMVELHWKEPPYIIRRSGCWWGTYTTTHMNDNEYQKTGKQEVEKNITLMPKSAERYLTMAKEYLEKNYADELVIVHSSKVGHSVLGINNLVYGKMDLPESLSLEDYLILSAHCPSEIKITFKKKVALRGVMNGTTPWNPTSSCIFLASGNIVGYLFGPLDMTREIILEPGDYVLEITSLNPGWRHSLWAIREVPEL